MPHHNLATMNQWLPPILHMNIPIAVSSYSKGARGLSVFPRVGGIFTSTTISLDPLLRQLPSRYAIHAGHRYSYGRRLLGLQFMPSPKLSNPFNLRAPGRRHTLYILLRVSRVLCFW